jgi:phosphatidate cytidylyltransferase
VDLRVRILSAAVLAPIGLTCLWFGGAAFTGLAAVMTVGLAYEWLKLCDPRITLPAASCFAALPASVVLTATGSAAAALLLLAVATGAAMLLAGGIGSARPLAFGIPYLGLGPVAMVWLRGIPENGRADVIILLLIVLK